MHTANMIIFIMFMWNLFWYSSLFFIRVNEFYKIYIIELISIFQSKKTIKQWINDFNAYDKVKYVRYKVYMINQIDKL